MGRKRWSDIVAKASTPEQVAQAKTWARAKSVELDLRELRKLLGRTQRDLAEAIKVSQAELSRAESRGDHRVSTLTRYVKALGGELEVMARFGERLVKLRRA